MRRAAADDQVRPLWQRDGAATQAAHAGVDPHIARREAELTSARERGYRDGYAEGERQAREQVAREAAEQAAEARRNEQAAIAQWEQQQARWHHLIAELPRALEDQNAQAHEAAVVATFAAVTRFLGERHAQGDLLRDMVEHALAHTPQAVVSLHVAPVDAEQLRGLDADIPVIADPQLRPGQCTLETARGQYDTGLDVRLDLLKSALLAGLAEFRSRAAP